MIELTQPARASLRPEQRPAAQAQSAACTFEMSVGRSPTYPCTDFGKGHGREIGALAVAYHFAWLIHVRQLSLTLLTGVNADRFGVLHITLRGSKCAAKLDNAGGTSSKCAMAPRSSRRGVGGSRALCSRQRGTGSFQASLSPQRSCSRTIARSASDAGRLRHLILAAQVSRDRARKPSAGARSAWPWDYCIAPAAPLHAALLATAGVGRSTSRYCFHFLLRRSRALRGQPA
jgi:hypothetical protein